MSDLNKLYERVAGLVPIERSELEFLSQKGINTEHDLKYISFHDLPDTVLIVTRRKICLVGQFLSLRGDLDLITTMDNVQTYVFKKQLPSSN